MPTETVIGPQHEHVLIGLVLGHNLTGRKQGLKGLHAAGLIDHPDTMAQLTAAGAKRLRTIASGDGVNAYEAQKALRHLADPETWKEDEEVDAFAGVA